MPGKNSCLWLRIKHELVFVEFGATPRPGDLVIVSSQNNESMQAKVYTSDHPDEDILGRVIASGSSL